MPETKPEVSVCVSRGGDAAVFVTRSPADGPLPVNLARLAAAFAARGLRLAGLSSSPQPATASCAGARSAPVTSGSIVDAVLSLLGDPQPAAA